ncbi:MAG: glycine/sarcosine/betaine reductase component B subunit [Clostridiales bacterium]|nr:glycine/sarcosine/betaine reductase component B subunit [Clostridiales bacterium]
MQLELREIKILDVRFGESTKVQDNILYVAQDEIRDLLLGDERISNVQVDLARPGESVRIIPVKDVVEPRAKLEGGEAFPGMDGKICDAGEGVTVRLAGAAVVTTGPIVGFQEGIIDMSGPLAQYTPFAHLNNVVLSIEKTDGTSPHEHEEALRIGGIKAAHFIAKKALECAPDDVVFYNWESIWKKALMYPDLPKVAYVYQCMSQGLLHDTYFYGKDSKKMLPTLVSPLSVFDGAIVSGNCVSAGSKTTTYHHQNNAVIKELFKRDGKELNFIGAVASPLMTTLADKYRNTALTARLVEMLGADGAVQSQEGFGNPTADLMMICSALEKKGIRTVLISNEDAGVDGKSEPLPDTSESADAMVSTGNSNATIELPPMDKVIGDLESLERLTGGCAGCIHEDGSLTIEIHGILGSHNLQGTSKLQAVTV